MGIGIPTDTIIEKKVGFWYNILSIILEVGL